MEHLAVVVRSAAAAAAAAVALVVEALVSGLPVGLTVLVAPVCSVAYFAAVSVHSVALAVVVSMSPVCWAPGLALVLGSDAIDSVAAVVQLAPVVFELVAVFLGAFADCQVEPLAAAAFEVHPACLVDVCLASMTAASFVEHDLVVQDDSVARLRAASLCYASSSVAAAAGPSGPYGLAWYVASQLDSD